MFPYQNNGADVTFNERAVGEIANYFKALSEPVRLKLLQLIRLEGELSVGEIARRLQCSQPNVSKHLATLHQAGLVAKQSVGTTTRYRLADPRVDELCNLVCASICDKIDQDAQADQTLRRQLAAAVVSEAQQVKLAP